MKASVIIPAYNSERTIEQCLGALKKQEFSDSFEVIVVDDGSIDSTAKIVKEFSKKNKKFRLIQQKNSGPAAARNNGAKNASHEIIVFLDSDCIAEKNWLEEMAKPFSDKKVAGAQGAYRSRQKHLIAIFGQIEIEQRYELMQKHASIDWIGSYSAAYRKNIFIEEGGFDTAFRIASGEDPDLSYTLSEKGHRLVFNPHAIVWHYHPSTIWKYLKTKFYRGFWRVRLYKKHAKKMFSDSYTPQELKLQIACFFGMAASTILGFFLRQFTGIALIFLAGIIALSIPFSLFAVRKNILIAMIAPIIIFFRTAAFSLGLLAGMLSKKVAA